MGYILYILSGLVLLSYLIKAALYPSLKWIIICTAIGFAFIMATWPFAIELSDIQIKNFISSLATRHNLSILIVAETATMIAFCMIKVKTEYCKQTGKMGRCFFIFLKVYPGILILGVLFYTLTQFVFMFPGVNFIWLSAIFGTISSLLLLGGALLTRFLIPAEELKLELLFIVNIAILLVSTVITGF